MLSAVVPSFSLLSAIDLARDQRFALRARKN